MLDFSEVYVDLKLNVCMGHGDHVPWVTLRVAPGFQTLNFKAKTLTKNSFLELGFLLQSL